MKFGRLLRNTSETLPEMRELFDKYKGLKKRLRRFSVCKQQSNLSGAEEEERSFVEGLHGVIGELNEAFLEREEELVMRLEELETESRDLRDPDAFQGVITKLADFHGEALLFMSWSMLAYTAAVKILKKHEKKSGHRVPGLEREDLNSLPICSTEIASSVIERAEAAINLLQGKFCSVLTTNAHGPEHQSEASRVSDAAVPEMWKRARAALEAWQQLVAGATTPSTIFQMGLHEGQAGSAASTPVTQTESDCATQGFYEISGPV